LILNTLYEKNEREMLHSKRVGEICEALAIKMNFDKEEINKIRLAGLMHDIGKIAIDEGILNKDGKLNQTEFNEIKRHSEIGYRILNSVYEFSDIASFVLEHHERWDGQGYPKGLKGSEISIQGRIICVADAFDAMTRERTYKEKLSVKEAIDEIRRCSGIQFDRNIVENFIEVALEMSDKSRS
jgi:putative nucleotidyltransferase with HDIG domain